MKRREMMVGKRRGEEVGRWLVLFDAAGNSKQPFI